MPNLASPGLSLAAAVSWGAADFSGGIAAKSANVFGVVALAHAVHELMNQRPTIDFGVVALCRALQLPPGAPLALLGVGRVVGWIAHGLEQYREGREIRPRARYAGEPPQA